MSEFTNSITDEMVMSAKFSQRAFEELFKHPDCIMIRKSLTKGLYDPWGDQHDLYQVIDIAFWLAVRDYKIDGKSKFTTWLNFVIKRKIADYLRVNNNTRNRRERIHMRLDEKVFQGDKPNDKMTYKDNIADLDKEPLSLLIEEESKNETVEAVNGILEQLSNLERKCLIGFYLEKKSYEKLMFELNISYKAVDNAIQRAKGKIKKAIFIEARAV